MPLIGNTKAYDLSSVLQFLADNRYSGSLLFYPKERKVEEVFYLVEGNLCVPLDSEGYPIFAKGAVLAPVDFATEEEKAEFLKKARFLAEEAMYERFFDEARYRFERDELPPEIQNHQVPTVTLPTGSILMEAARRIDDLRRMQEKYPQQGALYELTGEIQEEEKSKTHILQLMDGSRDMRQIAEEAGDSLYHVCILIAELLENQRGRIIPKEEYLEKLSQCVEANKLRSAVCLFTNICREKDIFLREQAAEILFRPEIWKGVEELKAFSSKMEGSVFTLLFRNIAPLQIPSGWHISFEDKKFALLLDKGKITIFEQEADHGMTTLLAVMAKTQVPPQLIRELRSKGEFRVSDIHQALLKSSISFPIQWETFLANRVVDLIAPLYNQVLQVEVVTPEEFSPPPGVPFECELTSEEHWDMLRMIIDQWVSVRDDAPPDLAIFTTSTKAKELIEKENPDPMGKFLRLFRKNRRTLAELYDTVKDQIGATEFFFKTVSQIAAMNLRPLTVEECKQLVKTAIMEEDYPRALKIIKSAEAMGYEDPYFHATKEDIRLRIHTEEGDRLIGDLKSFSLAEVLQNFITNQLTGTLRISSAHANQEIYFFQGEVYILKQDDVADEETLATFVSDSALEGLSLFSDEEIPEEELYEELAMHAQEQIYEIFLWDDAQFTFILDALPPEFFEEREDITKLELNTMSFLMGAVQRLEEWAEISQVIPSEKAIFKFVSPEHKQVAIASGMDPNLLYLIDGSHNIEDLIRISGKGKFEVCSLLYDLYQQGYVVSLDFPELIQRGKQAFDARQYEIAKKYYDYAAFLAPKDERIQRVVKGLEKRILAQKTRSS